MKEKIENLNFNELTIESSNELLNELLTYDDDDEFKELVINIIDSIEYSVVTNDSIPESINIIFNNDRVKTVIDTLLEEYKGLE